MIATGFTHLDIYAVVPDEKEANDSRGVSMVSQKKHQSTAHATKESAINASKMMKDTASVLLLLLVASTISSATVEEGDALWTMMKQWNVDFPTWKAGADPCLGWETVTCDNAGHVVGLNVSNRGINGLIPLEIGRLVHLEVLDASNAGSGGNVSGTWYENYTINSLSGPLPETLSNCVSLRSLNLSTILWNMSFPSVITTLKNLEEFRMTNANLTGKIPDEFFQLSELRQIYLGNNDLTAPLKNFSKLVKLEQLTLWGNDFNSTIPDEIGNLTELTYFNCHDCLLHGGLPNTFQNLKKLQNLTLNNNLLTGPVPQSWQALSNLPLLRLDNNYLSGPFPSWLLDLPLLKYLYLSKNLFSGPVPALDRSGQFNILRLDCNYLDGKTPPNPAIIPADFKVEWNCYSDATPADLNRVITSCGYSHTMDCSSFYKLIEDGQCPNCPTDQTLSSGTAGRNCICGYSGTSGRPQRISRLPLLAVVGGVLSFLLVLSCISIGVLWRRRQMHVISFDIFETSQQQGRGDLKDWEVPPGVERFTLEELARITSDFNDTHLIGAGGFGKVFSGILDDGRVVAIKRASTNLKTLQGLSEFRNEVTLLSRLHHRHLVRLEGFCDDLGYQILVYEFMKRGNLRTHLSGVWLVGPLLPLLSLTGTTAPICIFETGKMNTTPLHWYKRLEIAIGVAQGLEYLHSFADPPVIHRDVKPSNILLNGDMVAKLADFGISRVSSAYVTHVSTKPAGTAGYLDPSYFFKRQLTTASDVYAFGIVLLELVTGQKAIDLRRDDECNLIEWVNLKYRSGGIEAIVDPTIEYDYSKVVFRVMTDLALQCASFERSERPSMKVVVGTLEMHLAMKSLHAPALTKSWSVTKGPSGDQEQKILDRDLKHQTRGVYITFDSEYLDSSAPRSFDSCSLLSGPLSDKSGVLVPRG